MKKNIIIILLAFSINSCESGFDIEKYEITKIEVFHIPFGILAPTQSDESSIRKLKGYHINNNSKIENIKTEIKNLSKASFTDKLNDNHIYLVCDFYTKDKKVFTLFFDKNLIQLDGKTYENKEELINLLIKKN